MQCMAKHELLSMAEHTGDSRSAQTKHEAGKTSSRQNIKCLVDVYRFHVESFTALSWASPVLGMLQYFQITFMSTKSASEVMLVRLARA